MKNKVRLTAVLLTLALLLCLLPVSALAAAGSSPEAEPAPEETAEPEPSAARPAAAIIAQGETGYAAADSVIFNNGGTVFNNGGTVYNNQGTVYNNAGTAYNNEGTVYANGGTVYNNAGTVYDNGARIISHNGGSQSAVPQGFHQVRFAADYSAFAEAEGLEESESGVSLLAEEKDCVIRPKEGFHIGSAETTAGTLEAQPDGSYILSGLEADAELTMSFKPDAPVFSLAPGSYAESQYVELTAPEGTTIYFTDDGSEPEVGKGRYAGSISIRNGAVIKAIAVAEGSEISDQAEGSFAVLRVEGPVFETAQKGYSTQVLPIRVVNPGQVDGTVSSVGLSGENAKQFYLSHTSGRTVEAGSEISEYWTVQPLEKLEPGTYTALATVTLDGGETVELELSFTVED